MLAPLTVSLLVDDSAAAQPVIQYYRDGINGFLDAMDGKAEIALATVGDRPTSVVDYTQSTVALKKAVTRIFARQGAGAYLLDAIVDVSKGLQKREGARPVIVAITIEDGPEFSNRYYEPVLEEQTIEAFEGLRDLPAADRHSINEEMRALIAERRSARGLEP